MVKAILISRHRLVIRDLFALARGASSRHLFKKILTHIQKKCFSQLEKVDALKS